MKFLLGFFLRCTAILSLAVSEASGRLQDDPARSDDSFGRTVQPFLVQHCHGCHSQATAKAGFRVDLVGDDFGAPAVAAQWKEVLDRITAGEMPPADQPRPSPAEAARVLDWINQQLRGAEAAVRHAGVGVPFRRLNREEFANSIRDLLGLDERLVRPLIEELPADGKAEGFDRLGTALFVDQSQIERTLAAAARVAELTIVTEPPKVNTLVNRFELHRLRPRPADVEVFPGFAHRIPRGAEDYLVHPQHIEFIQGGPTYRRDYAGWGVVAHFSIAQTVTQDGYYRIRIRAKVDDRGRSEVNKFRLRYALNSPIQVEEEVQLDPSGVTEATLFLRGPVNGEVKGPQVFNMLWNHTENAVIAEPAYKAVFSDWTRLRGALERAAAERAPQDKVDALLAERAEVERKLNAWTGVANIFNPAMEVEKLPRLLLESVEIEGPVQPVWPPEPHRRLLFAGDDRHDAEYVEEIFAKLLPRAYRRPVTPEEVRGVAAIVQQAESGGGHSFHEALRIGLQRVLCSPGFLFLGQPPQAAAALQPQSATQRRIGSYELASRLSYFLWSSMPDEELFALAASDRLRDPDVLRAQVSRMLADPKSAAFVENFAGQWLSVRDFGSIKPAAEYREYDQALEDAARKEPLAFFTEVLAGNLPITVFLDSDFLVINERLARHYGIAGVAGGDFRRVAISPGDHRGGVLGMAGLMTYLADGTRTLPMRRGSWVLRELFNDPPNNPPPNAGEIQPNTSGQKLTVRQRLELHRRDTICASCHDKLDPYGLALENYDAIGAWRERFNGEGVHGGNAPLLDVSGSFPDGRRFADLNEFKAGLMDQKTRFAAAFSRKLATYALCRPIGFADEQFVRSLVLTLEQHEYRIQSLIQAIVTSDEFLSY
jgi:mono/diheme cytochrome c family protein